VILRPLDVAGAFALEPAPSHDERGWFARLWDADILSERGLVGSFVQQSAAWNARAGTVRGLHVARPPARETKIVRCVRGAVVDVIADVRPASPSFGAHVRYELSAENRRALYVPAGCAHGYQTLTDDSELIYDISETYRGGLASGVRYDDPLLGIAWPLPVSVISPRDASLPTLERYLCIVDEEVLA
jgi:dTDP-4-dehydrorhamnose 3,5-epimerase